MDVSDVLREKEPVDDLAVQIEDETEVDGCMEERWVEGCKEMEKAVTHHQTQLMDDASRRG